MKRDFLPELPDPLAAVTVLDGPPDMALLLKLLAAAEQNVERLYCFRWSPRRETRLELCLTCPARRQSNAWSEGGRGPGREPDWQLQQIQAGELKVIWTVETRDLTVITNLLSSQSPQSLAETSRRQTAANLPPPQFGPKVNSLQQAVLNRLGLPDGVKNGASNSPAGQNLQLAGNFKDVDMMDVLQSINLCQLTGKLSLSQIEKQIDLYFVAGELSHAIATETLRTDEATVGDQAVLELFVCQDGTFQFQHGWKNEQLSVRRKLPSLIMEGASLQDYQRYLLKHHLSSSSILAVSPQFAAISEAEFDTLLGQGIAKHQDLQKIIFLRLKRATSLGQLVLELKLHSSIWIPIIYNLLNLGLISLQ